MSMELVQKTLAEIQGRDAAHIAAKAQQLQTELAEGISNEVALRQKVDRFLAACQKNKDDASRGVLGRLVRGSVELRTELYYEHMEADFVTSLQSGGQWGRRLMHDRQPVYPEQGMRTLTFDTHEIIVEDTVITMGWQAGLVESRQVQNPSIGVIREKIGPATYGGTFRYADGKQQFEAAENTDRPVRIWRVASGAATDGSETESREVTHDIHRRNGEMITYANDLKEDAVIGFSSHMFALVVLQNAIDFLEH